MLGKDCVPGLEAFEPRALFWSKHGFKAKGKL